MLAGRSLPTLDLGGAILKGHEDEINLSEQELLRIIKQLAFIPVSVVLRKSDFLSPRQDLIENPSTYDTRL